MDYGKLKDCKESKGFPNPWICRKGRIHKQPGHRPAFSSRKMPEKIVQMGRRFGCWSDLLLSKKNKVLADMQPRGKSKKKKKILSLLTSHRYDKSHFYRQTLNITKSPKQTMSDRKSTIMLVVNSSSTI